MTFLYTASPFAWNCKSETTSTPDSSSAREAVIGEMCGNKGIHVHLCENSASKPIPVGGSDSGTAGKSVRSPVFLP